MTNPMFNPQPNYSGVTIQITNPAVNVGTGDCAGNCATVNGYPKVCSGYIRQTSNLNGLPNKNGYGYSLGQVPQNNYVSYPNSYSANSPDGQRIDAIDDANVMQAVNGHMGITNPMQGYPAAYPAQYYMNNYNYGPNNGGVNDGNPSSDNLKQTKDYMAPNGNNSVGNAIDNNNVAKEGTVTSYKAYAAKESPIDDDQKRSQNIIGDIDERVAEEQKEKKNTKETKIIALTDEYIKSLENYLNHPNDEIRLMASKEVLKRLDEDKDRYNDAALNALLNKMMQDPSKLVRLASLSAFSSQLASGNNYTVKLLRDIQSNPNADKEDVLQAADILLKMSAGVEVKNMPIPENKSKKTID